MHAQLRVKGLWSKRERCSALAVPPPWSSAGRSETRRQKPRQKPCGWKFGLWQTIIVNEIPEEAAPPSISLCVCVSAHRAVWLMIQAAWSPSRETTDCWTRHLTSWHSPDISHANKQAHRCSLNTHVLANNQEINKQKVCTYSIWWQ